MNRYYNNFLRIKIIYHQNLSTNLSNNIFILSYKFAYYWYLFLVIDVIEVPVIVDAEVVPIGVVLFEVTPVWDANANIGLAIIKQIYWNWK